MEKFVVSKKETVVTTQKTNVYNPEHLVRLIDVQPDVNVNGTPYFRFIYEFVFEYEDGRPSTARVFEPNYRVNEETGEIIYPTTTEYVSYYTEVVESIFNSYVAKPIHDEDASILINYLIDNKIVLRLNRYRDAYGEFQQKFMSKV